MAIIRGLMDIGVKSLKANQLSLEVASHNIANVNTPGYSKQSAMVETSQPLSLGSVGQIGTGSDVTNIQRIYDSFTTAQINSQQQDYGEAIGKQDILKSAELIFNESDGQGLSTALGDFFNAWEELANNPASLSARESVIQNGDALAKDFFRIADHVNQIKDNTERSITSNINEINNLTAQIVDLNFEIKSVEAGEENANDLRDKRDALVKDLSEKIGIHTVESADGTTAIYLNRGIVLVESMSRRTLSTAVTLNEQTINIEDENGNKTDITKFLTGGILGGLVNARDDKLDSYLQDLNELAARVIVEVNKLHYTGYGLDGSTNNLFFDQAATSAAADSSNTGGATIGPAAVSDPIALTADDYEIRFTAPAVFDVVNTTTGVTVASGAAYTSGANITFDGLTVAVTDGGSGPANGDVFTVGLDKTDTAYNIAMNNTLSGSVKMIAVAQEDPMTVSGEGDNRNALAIADLKNQDLMNNGADAFIDFYSSLSSRVGFDVQSANNDVSFFEFSLQQLENLRESISGVSIDEETVNIIKFQNGYAAGARLINVANELLGILVTLGQ